MTHMLYKGLQYIWMIVDIIYYLIVNVLLYHIHHIRYGDICGNEHISCECIWNEYQLELFYWQGKSELFA